MIRILITLLLVLVSLTCFSQRGVKTKSVETDTLKISVVLVNLGDTVLTINPSTGLVGYKTISAYNMFIRGDTLFVNDTAFAYYGDVNKWTQSSGKLYPTTSTDVIVALDSLRADGHSLFKDDLTVNLSTDTTSIKIKTANSRFTVRPQVMIYDSLDVELMRMTKTGENSIYIGKVAGGSNDTVYDSVLISGSYYHYNARNVGIGDYVLQKNQQGYANVGVGYMALSENRGDTAWQGEGNVAIGTEAMQYNENGIENVGVGLGSLRWGVDISNNTGVGYVALCSDTLGGNNTAIGSTSLTNNRTGSGSFAGGSAAGRYVSGGGALTQADSSVFIGLDTRAAADSQTNQIVIGALAIGKGSNTATIGDDNVTDVWMSEDAGAILHTGNLTLLSLVDDATADSVLTTEGGITKRTAFSVIIDTTQVLFLYDTLPTAASAKISTRYDVDTLSLSVYDTLNRHWDTLVSHNTRININLDSITAHNARINTNLDSITSHNTRINNNVDTLVIHLDSIQSHNDRINLNVDSIAAHNTRILALKDSIAIHLDTLQAHNTRILATLDSLDRHTDTLQSHNLRILALKDSLAAHLDSLQTHNTRLLSLSDTVSVHLDSLQSHNNRINAIINSLGDNVYTAKFSLSVVEVALLGSLICVQFPNVPDSGYVQVLSAEIALYSVAQLDVGTQTLHLKYSGGNNIVQWTEAQIEKAAGAYIISGAILDNYDIIETQWLGLQLSASTNPGGVPNATMDLYVTFRYIDMSGTGGSVGCP